MKSKLNKNDEEDSSAFSNDFSIQNELYVKHGENLTSKMSKILAEKSEKSVCEIIKDNGYGSGFFCKINLDGNEICCLFSNNHVITEEMLTNEESIEIKLDKETYYISLKLKRRIWSDKDLDFTCIEIIKEDNLIEKVELLEIDKNNYNIEYELENYNKRGIVIASIGGKGDIELPQGVIYNVKNSNNLFLHNCNTEPGFSGGPIILISSLRVMGIHRGYDETNNKNIGIYFKEIIEMMEKKVIKCLIDIRLKEIKDGILLLNSNKNKEEDKFKVFLNKKKIEVNNKENKYIINKNNFEKDG